MSDAAESASITAAGDALEVRVPGDKSISHRALMLAPLAHGVSRVGGLADGADVRATGAAMRALGADLDWDVGDPAATIRGGAPLGSPASPIDCGNSGTSARLLIGLVAGLPLRARFTGDESLRRRPMSRVVEPLRTAGADIRELGGPGLLPLEVRGGGLSAIQHELSVASAQVKSSLMLGGLGSRVPVRIREPGPSRDHTERMLQTMGVTVKTASADAGGWSVEMEPASGELQPLDFTVPGDISSAAYWLVLALLGGAGPRLRVRSVGLNPRRTGVLDALAEMGAGLELVGTGDEAGEPVGDVAAEPSQLVGLELPPEWLPRLLDEIPLLACAATRCEGTFTVRGAGELRVKESDRIATVCRNLAALGAAVEEFEDGLRVVGGDQELKGSVETAGDHRVAMAFGVLGALPGNRIRIDDRECAAVSYPDFWNVLRTIGRTQLK